MSEEIMVRETFPYQPDRDVVEAFLRGLYIPAVTEQYTSLDTKGLRYQDTLIAWFDSGGALIASPMTGISYHGSVRLLHYLLDQLGIDARFTLEGGTWMERKSLEESATREMHHFYDGSEIKLGDPIEVCGPLTIQAFRGASPLTRNNTLASSGLKGSTE